MFIAEFDAEDEEAAKGARSRLLEYLRTKSDDATSLLVVEQIFAELVANVAEHGNSVATVALTWLRDGSAQLDVVDRGPGVDLSHWHPASEYQEHGRGLVIVNALSSEVTVTQGPDGSGTRVRAVLPLRLCVYTAG